MVGPLTSSEFALQIDEGALVHLTFDALSDTLPSYDVVPFGLFRNLFAGTFVIAAFGGGQWETCTDITVVCTSNIGLTSHIS